MRKGVSTANILKPNTWTWISTLVLKPRKQVLTSLYTYSIIFAYIINENNGKLAKLEENDQKIAAIHKII